MDRLIKELVAMATERAMPQIKILASNYRADIIKNMGDTYPNVTRALTAILRYQTIEVSYKTGIGIQIIIRHFDSKKLDEDTPTYMKKDFSGEYKRYNTTGLGGWWRYFEEGTNEVSFGSNKYGFVPGKHGGGSMVPLNNLKNNPTGTYIGRQNANKGMSSNSPHPGVHQLRMFQKTFDEWCNGLNGKYIAAIKKIIENELNKLTSKDIQLALEKIDVKSFTHR